MSIFNTPFNQFDKWSSKGKDASNALEFKNIARGVGLNVSLFGISVNASTNVETSTSEATVKWKRARRKLSTTENIIKGETLLATFPLFYTKVHGNADASKRFIYDKILENPLYIEMGLELNFKKSRTGLNPNDVIVGKKVGQPYFAHNPDGSTGYFVDFEFIADRDVPADSTVGVKIYIEDTTSGPVYRLPRGRSILVSADYDSFEYTFSGQSGVDNTNSRGTIFTETEYTPTVSSAVLGSFTVFALKKKTDKDSVIISGDSIFEGAYSGQSSDGTALTVSDPSGDQWQNVSWAGVFVGSKLGLPYVNIGRGSDLTSYHAPTYVNAAGHNLPAYGGGVVTSGNYLRRALAIACGGNILIEGSGSNDVASSYTYAQFSARKVEDIALFKAANPKLRIYPAFLLPRGRALDSTLAGLVSPLHQTGEAYNRSLTSGHNAVRMQFKRALITNGLNMPIDGYVDNCSLCENDPVNGDNLWAAFSSTFQYPLTPDQIHPHQKGEWIIGHSASIHSFSGGGKVKDGVIASETMLALNNVNAQRIYVNPRLRAFKLTGILLTSATLGTSKVNLAGSAVSLAFYSDAACTVPITDAIGVTSMVDENSIVELVLNAAGLNNILRGDIWMKLSTAHGTNAYVNAKVMARVLD